MKNPVDYSKYRCPYSHLKKECGHELKGPEGFADTFGVWCACGFRGPVFYLEPSDLKLELKDAPVQQTTSASTPCTGCKRLECTAGLNLKNGRCNLYE